MALAFVNAAKNSAAGDTSTNSFTTAAANHTTGNLLSVSVKYEGASTTVSIADTAGNTYTPRTARHHSNGDLHIHTFDAQNITGNASNVLTITLGAARSFRDVIVLQYSGAATSSAFDQENFGEGTGVNLSTGNITTTQADEVLIAHAADYNGNSYTQGTNFTERIDLSGTPSNCFGAAEDRIVTSTGTYNATMTSNNGGDYLLTITSYKAATAAQTLAAGAGSYAFTGTAASLLVKRVVTAGAGSYAFTGTAATLRRNIPVVAGAGSYAFTGTAASVLHGWKLAAGVGSYAFTGTAASVLHGWKLAAGVGSYAFTGTDATLRRNIPVVAGAGSYAFSGTDATIIPGSAKTLAAGVGSYSFSGTNASVLHGWKVAAGAGSYAFTGTAVNLNKGATLTAGAGSYAFSGTSASLFVNKLLSAGPGIYLFSGTAAQIVQQAVSTSRWVDGGYHPHSPPTPERRKKKKEPEVVIPAVQAKPEAKIELPPAHVVDQSFARFVVWLEDQLDDE